MDELIIRMLSGTASPFELERLKRWREEAPANERRFQDTAAVWAVTTPEPVAIVSAPPGTKVITEAAIPLSPMPAPAADNGEPSIDTKKPGRPRWGRWTLLAASLAALAVSFRVLGFGTAEPLATYTAPAGESRTVTLTDGSFARLAPGARLDEWQVDGAREVGLDGRAFFAVASDSARPFSVRTGAGTVTVLGTRFEVANVTSASGAPGTRIVVVEGRVAVSNDLGSVEVPAGSVGLLDESTAPALQATDDVWALLDWPEGLLVFHATPLSQVAREVARHYDRPVTVSGDALGGRRITAWFQADPFEEVIESLCLVAEAGCRQVGDGVAMEPVGGGR